MTQVPTVRGPVDASALGATLMHEHVFVRNPELEANYPFPEWDEEAMLATARAGLTELAGKGIATFVDLTVLGLGRYVPRIQRLAEGLPMNIVVATGYYTAKDLPPYFHTHGPGRRIDMPDPLEAMFLRDLTEGIGDTGVKAGVIKVVTDEFGITPDVERVLRAAARAHLETGALISTHTNVAYETGRLQQDFFREQGVDPGRVVIGHSGDSTDLDYLRGLMDNGSTLGMDRFGSVAYLPDDDRVATIVTLCEQGYADRMTLSHDAGFYSVNTEPSFRAKNTPDWHHAHISDNILPELRRRGVTEEQITQMMVTNPARLLPASTGR